MASSYCRKENLHLLIDSTGIKVEGEGKWQRRKHGGSRRRARHGPMTSGGHGPRRKIHIAVDEHKLEIRAVEVTSSAIGDAPVLPDLLNQIAPQEAIARVTVDGAYDTRACPDAIAARGAVAVIPPRKNACLWKPTMDGAEARNEHLGVLAAPSGGNGAGITVAAGWRPR